MTTYAWFVRGEPHARLCRMSVASVRKHDPAARCFVYTDEQFPVAWQSEVNIAAGLIYLPRSSSIMMANIEAQLCALYQSLCRDPDEMVVFLDTDTLLLRPLPAGGDMTITWRDHVGMRDEEKIEGVAGVMPYNYGVMAASPTLWSIDAFMYLRERIRKLQKPYQDWYGNQMALAELAGPRPESGATNEVRRIPWMLSDKGREGTITKLPCDPWNYTPQGPDEDVSAKGVLHFKGGARPLMEGYAQRLGVA